MELKEGQSLLQIAAASEFPAAGAPPQVHHRGRAWRAISQAGILGN